MAVKNISPVKQVLVCVFIVSLPLSQGCSVLRKPDFSYDRNQAFEVLDPPESSPPWLLRTTDFGHHVGRATLISALVGVYGLIRWTDLFEDDDDDPLGFDFER